MSVQAMAWAMAQRFVTKPGERHVLLCLANYADAEGRNAFPGVPKLARDVGIEPRSVQRVLRCLEAAGAIRQGDQRIVAAYIERGDRRPVVYDLAMEKGVCAAPESPVEEAQRGDSVSPRDPERGDICDATGRHSEHHGVTSDAERGDTGVTQSIIDPSRNPSRNPGPRAREGGERSLFPVPVSGAPPPAVIADDIDRAYAAFAAMAAETGLPVPKKLDPDRRARLRARLVEWGPAAWDDALTRIRGSPFCLGDNDRGWRIYLAALCQKKTFRNLMEGRYDDKRNRNRRRDERRQGILEGLREHHSGGETDRS